MVSRHAQIRHSHDLNPDAAAQGVRADRIDRWLLEQSEETDRMVSLRDVQHFCHNGTFPARRSRRYGNLTSFTIKLQTLGAPTREVRISPDDCRSVAELKALITANTREWYGESFLLNAATLEVEERPNVENTESIKFSIEHDDEWKEWRERVLVYGRQTVLRITVWLDPIRNPQLERVATR